MQGVYLKLFVPEGLRHHHELAYEWILQQAQRLGIPGGSALRALAGYGRHGRLHEQHFFELAGDMPIILEFFASETAVTSLLSLLREEKLSLFYIRTAAEGGLTDALT
ncbi:MAG TPA: DUF190 domain-containing protein [Methylophilaceae bacterium]|nr:DUF190 domain-containing protein [Methylophilaceae bacterium]